VNPRRLPWVIAGLCVVVIASSIVGSLTYKSYTDDLADARVQIAAEQVRQARDLAQVARTVCRRQNQVVAVLAYLVSPQLQRNLARTDNTEALIVNRRVIDLVERIEASPCG
jgi:hypothetical protein